MEINSFNFVLILTSSPGEYLSNSDWKIWRLVIGTPFTEVITPSNSELIAGAS